MPDLSFPTRPEAVTPEWLTAVLQAQGALKQSARVLGFEPTRIGTGQIGQNVRFALTYSGPSEAWAASPASVVGKFASPDPTSRATGVALGTYQREHEFYRDIAPGASTRLATCFANEFEPETHEFVLLMEDLGAARVGDQIVGCGPDDASRALAAIAPMQAQWWNSPRLREYDWLAWVDDAERSISVQGLYTMLWPGFVERFGPRMPAGGLELGERLTTGLSTWATRRRPPFTVTHGDYRLDNCLFGDGWMVPVDWQGAAVGCAASDVAYFLGAGLLVEDRRAYELDLVKEWWKLLEQAELPGFAQDFSWERCWEEYRAHTFSGVIVAVVASTITERTERGDEMFTAMASRHLQHALDLGAAEFL